MKSYLVFFFLLLGIACIAQPGFYKESTISFYKLYKPGGNIVTHNDVPSGKVQFYVESSNRQLAFAKANAYDSSSFFLRLEGSSSWAATSLVIVTPTDTMYLLNLPDNNVNVELGHMKIRTGVFNLQDYLDTITVDRGKCDGFRIKDCTLNMDTCICDKGGTSQFIVYNEKKGPMVDLRYKDHESAYMRSHVQMLQPFIFSDIMHKRYPMEKRRFQFLRFCWSDGKLFSM